MIVTSADRIIRPVLRRIKGAVLWARDAAESIRDRLKGAYDPLLPPRRLRTIWGEGFQKIGNTFARHLVDLGGLRPTDRVLDVGCGIGRMAIPLTRYLSPEGLYEGFDMIPCGIRWCQKAVSRRFPSFRFQLADIFNGIYHPAGTQTAATYGFPFENGSFNFILLVSVFTHMLPDDMENYFREISRVLVPGGRCFITYFLLNGESENLLHAGRSRFAFTVDHGPYKTVEGQAPEFAVAYDESYVRRLYEGNGLAILDPVHYGQWCGRARFLDYQDIVVACKRGGPVKEEGQR